MTLGLVVGLPLSAVLLWLAVRDAEPEVVWTALRSAHTFPLALAVAVLGGVYLLQGMRWRRIARTPEIPALRFAGWVVSGVAVNNVVPGRVGDLVRARWLQVAARLRGGLALSTVFVDRVFDVVTLSLFLLVSLPFVASAAWLRRIVFGACISMGGLAAVLLGARLYTRANARERRERGVVRRVVRDTVEGLADPIGRRRGTRLLALSLLAWGTWALAAWLVARSLGIELTVLDVVFVTAVMNLGVAIPSSPGFVGTYQWLGVASLGLLGVTTEAALAFAILMHAAWYVPTLVAGGGLLLVRMAVASSRLAGSTP
ncbi:MAG: lysylphosphatidylglycerol synthase transmembrane domain-containing protein, partial [Thermoleophilia bacterium]|nr:lysylphosphatidylglycerol synthase transmembrane domain-containing protein [Thermoleophilia bacterium]